MAEEKLPISEALKVLEATTLYKTERWWSAVALVESFGRKQIAVYLWNKRDEAWKRRQKFVVHNKAEWSQMKESIEKYAVNLP